MARARSKLQIFEDFENTFGWQVAIFNADRSDEEKERAFLGIIACHEFYLEQRKEIPAELKSKLDKWAERAVEIILRHQPPDD